MKRKQNKNNYILNNTEDHKLKIKRETKRTEVETDGKRPY